MKSKHFKKPILIICTLCTITISAWNIKTNQSKTVQIIEKDTVKINGLNVKTSFLKEGNHSYLVYFKKGKNANKSNLSVWNRTVKKQDFAGQKSIVITQKWESNDTIVHTVKSVSDLETMQTIYHESWWKDRDSSKYDFQNKTASINDLELSDNLQDEKQLKAWNAYKTSWDTYSLNWHSDLEVFSI